MQTIRKALGNCGEFYDWNRVTKQESAIVPSNDDRHLPPDVFANPWILTQAGRTDLANARRFAKAHGANVRWIDVWGQWFVWDGRRWKLDDECRITELARATASDLWREVERAEGWLQANVHDDRERERTKAGLNAFARSSSSAPGVRHFLTLAQGEQGIAINHERLDRHEWLFNVANGTIDLRTGKLVPHNREHLLTKLNMVAYDFDARCPLWRKFIKEVCESDDDLASYLQRLVGYCLTGSTRDHVLPFLHGTGANGKSVFCSVVAAMLGDGYAMLAAPELLMARTGEQHPTERADLFGKRLVITNEIDSGRRLNEALVKDLTGGDKIRARRMREDFWEFEPTHKVWMVGNHKPRIEGTDNGIWRRVKLIPFTRVFSESEQDKDLPRKLLAELPGILNWAIDGCLSWQRDGLGEPAAVASATSEYRSEQDIVGAFISECCIVNPGISSRASELYAAYREWAEKTGDRALNNREFGSELGKRFERFTSNGACYRSVGLRATEGFE